MSDHQKYKYFSKLWLKVISWWGLRIRCDSGQWCQGCGHLQCNMVDQRYLRKFTGAAILRRRAEISSAPVAYPMSRNWRTARTSFSSNGRNLNDLLLEVTEGGLATCGSGDGHRDTKEWLRWVTTTFRPWKIHWTDDVQVNLLSADLTT